MAASIESIANTLKSLESEVTEVAESNKDILKTKNEILDRFNNYETDYLNLRTHTAILEDKLNRLEKELNYLMNRERSRNIVVFNVDDSDELKEDPNESAFNLLHNIVNDLEKDEIKEVKLLKAKDNKRPIIISFYKPQSKAKVFKKVEELRKAKIFIANDLSVTQRKEEMKIYMQKITAAGGSAYLKDNKLKFNGKLYDVSTIKTICEMPMNEKGVQNIFKEKPLQTTSIIPPAPESKTPKRKRGQKVPENNTANQQSKKPRQSQLLNFLTNFDTPTNISDDGESETLTQA